MPESTNYSVKRDRSDSPESPAYDVLPGMSLTETHNDRKKMKMFTQSQLTDNHFKSNIDHFFQSMQHEEYDENIDENALGNDGKQTDTLSNELKSYDRQEFRDVLSFIRYYLFDGRTSREVEEQLQLHVSQICNLKKAANRGTERTAGRQRMHALQKSYAKLGLEQEASFSDLMKQNSKHV